MTNTINLPSDDDLQALMMRGRRERSRAFHQMLAAIGGWFARRRTAGDNRATGIRSAAC